MTTRRRFFELLARAAAGVGLASRLPAPSPTLAAKPLRIADVYSLTVTAVDPSGFETDPMPGRIVELNRQWIAAVRRFYDEQAARFYDEQAAELLDQMQADDERRLTGYDAPDGRYPVNDREDPCRR
jgi:LAS superfamily LD-carboxypeptidase LdcB